MKTNLCRLNDSLSFHSEKESGNLNKNVPYKRHYISYFRSPELTQDGQ